MNILSIIIMTASVVWVGAVVAIGVRIIMDVIRENRDE